MSALTPEGKVKRKVVQVLKKYRVWYFFPAANGFGRAGIPDIVAIVRGRFVGIEVKADRTKKLTALQAQCAEQIKAAGGAWFLVCDDESRGRLEQFLRGEDGGC